MKSTLGAGAARRGPICRLAVSRTVCALALFALSSSCNPAVEVEDDGAGWGKEVAIDTADTRGAKPRVVIDADGNGVAVWMTGNDQDGYQLATNHYTPGLGWAGVELMGDIVDQPDIAMGRDGGRSSLGHLLATR